MATITKSDAGSARIGTDFSDSVVGTVRSHGTATFSTGEEWAWESTYGQEDTYKVLARAANSEGRRLTGYVSQAVSVEQ